MTLLFATVLECIGYRKRVVRGNLERSFPSASKRELRSYEHLFYRHLVFQMLSTPKFLLMSPRTLRRYLSLENLDLLEDLKREGHGAVIVLMGHYGHWELFAHANIYLSEVGYRQEQLYRPQKNQIIDSLAKYLRERLGAVATPKNDAGRALLKAMRRDGAPTAIAFIADQSPSARNVHYITDFLHQPTAMLNGAERLAQRCQTPVVYLDVFRVRDNKYRGVFRLISKEPKETRVGEITELYTRLMETTIQRNPPYWLWSHRRWKIDLSKYPDLLEKYAGNY